MNCKSHYRTASCVPAQETPPQLRCRRVSQTFHCPATPEFQKAVSDTIASVKGYKPVTELGDQPDPSAIQSVQLVKDDTSGACTGTAYVKFGMAEDALLAIQTICGNPLPDGSTIGVFVKPGAGHHTHLRTNTASIRCHVSVAFQRATHVGTRITNRGAASLKSTVNAKLHSQDGCSMCTQTSSRAGRGRDAVLGGGR
eukprot:s4526_g4.t1